MTSEYTEWVNGVRTKTHILHSLVYWFRGSSGSRMRLKEEGPRLSLLLKLLTIWRWALLAVLPFCCLRKAVLTAQVSKLVLLLLLFGNEKIHYQSCSNCWSPTLSFLATGGLWSPNAELLPLPGLLHLLRIHEANLSFLLGTKRNCFSIVCPSPPALRPVVL